MAECAFCEIASGKAEVHQVYVDNLVVAFLDHHPINPGHILVIPRVHESVLFDLGDEVYGHLMLVVKRLAGALQTFAKPVRVGLVVAGWDVPHAHVHIVPMHEYHDITSRSLLEGRRANPGQDELAEVAKALQALV